MAGLYRVVARFLDGAGSPLQGEEYRARLFDADAISDDELGTSTLDETGTAAFVFTRLDLGSLDSPGESLPDLYVILERVGIQIFRSPVLRDVDMEELDPVTGTAKGLTRELGPFLITE